MTIFIYIRKSRQILSYLGSCTFWCVQYFLLLLAVAHNFQFC